MSKSTDPPKLLSGKITSFPPLGSVQAQIETIASGLKSQPVKMPESVFIFGRTVKVIYDAELANEDGNYLYGDYSTVNDTIRINSRYPLEMQQSTLLHEVIHAIEYSCNLPLSEETVVALETGLMTAMKHITWR